MSLAIAFALTRGRLRPEVPSRDGNAKVDVQRVGQWMLVVLLVVGATAFGAWPETFRERAHSASAILMFVGILFVVFFNGLRINDPSRVDAPTSTVTPPPATVTGRGRSLFISSHSAGTIYRWLARVMAVSIALTLVLHLTLTQWRYSVLVIEAVLLLEFLVFWLVQTSELWFDQAEPPPPTAPAIAPSAEVSA